MIKNGVKKYYVYEGSVLKARMIGDVGSTSLQHCFLRVLNGGQLSDLFYRK